MKKIINLLTSAFALCIMFAVSASAMSLDYIKGSGNIVQEKREVSNFKKIVIKGSADVLINMGNQENAVVETDDNIVKLIRVYVEGDALIIDTKQNTSISTKFLKVHVNAKKIEGLFIKGSGDITGTNKISSDKLEIGISGSGDVKLTDLYTKNLKIEIMGSGDVELKSGQAVSNNVSIMGSGDVKMKKLSTDQSYIEIMGSGDVEVNAAKELKAEIKGSGDVEYYGNPAKTDFRKNGSGDIIKK